MEGFIDIAFDEVPRMPLFQPLLDVAMQKNVTGYRYWFHRQLDYRQLAKALNEAGLAAGARRDASTSLAIR